MSDDRTNEQLYCCAIMIEYSDGGPSEAQLLHTGTLEECAKVKALVPALAYAGSRPDPVAHVVLITKDMWDRDTVPMEAA